jgi:hypothetical protein
VTLALDMSPDGMDAEARAVAARVADWIGEQADPPNSDGCRLWRRGRNHHGYGTSGGTLAHRRVWIVAYGAPPPGMCVCHTCDVRACVSLDHLWLGTNADNVADRQAKGRSSGGRTGPKNPARGDRNGSRLYPERRARLPGEKNPMAKLTEERVREIRAQHASGRQQNEIAGEVGVSASTIGRVVRGVLWRHV